MAKTAQCQVIYIFSIRFQITRIASHHSHSFLRSFTAKILLHFMTLPLDEVHSTAREHGIVAILTTKNLQCSTTFSPVAVSDLFF